MEKATSELIHDCAAALGRRALTHTITCTTAESCTGGMIAAAITDIPGSSGWFDRSFVTYSNQAKAEMLGVSKSTLQQYGAVSEPVVIQMAESARKAANVDLAVAVSGVAGPGGGSVEKPVGTVCFAWTLGPQKNVYTCTKLFAGDRAEVRMQACLFALKGMIATLDHTIENLLEI